MLEWHQRRFRAHVRQALEPRGDVRQPAHVAVEHVDEMRELDIAFTDGQHAGHDLQNAQRLAHFLTDQSAKRDELRVLPFNRIRVNRDECVHRLLLQHAQRLRDAVHRASDRVRGEWRLMVRDCREQKFFEKIRENLIFAQQLVHRRALPETNPPNSAALCITPACREIDSLWGKRKCLAISAMKSRNVVKDIARRKHFGPGAHEHLDDLIEPGAGERRCLRVQSRSQPRRRRLRRK